MISIDNSLIASGLLIETHASVKSYNEGSYVRPS